MQARAANKEESPILDKGILGKINLADALEGVEGSL